MVVTVSDKASCYKSSRTLDCGETLALGLDPALRRSKLWFYASCMSESVFSAALVWFCQ